MFSFADIAAYRKVKHNLKEPGINYVEWDENRMTEFGERLVELNKKWDCRLATCGEKIELPNVEHNSCIDHDLIIRLAHRDRALMDYLGVTKIPLLRDMFGNADVPAGGIVLDDGTVAVQKKRLPGKGQRATCGCMVSRDIGQYNTCPHLCEYCYANTNKETALANWQQYQASPLCETIVR